MSTTADLLLEAKAAAIQRLSDVFTHPDDIHTKFPSFRAKIVSEKASIDAQLKSALEALLEDAQRGLDVLDSSKVETLRVKDNLSNIQTLLSDAHNSIDNYSKIMQNFVATRDMIRQFQALNTQIARISHFLEQDMAEVVGDHPNLLFIHYQLHVLQEFRANIMKHMKNSSSDVTGTLNNYFRKIDKLAEDFDVYFWTIAKNTLKLVKAGHTSVVVKVVKIIENEEKQDENFADAVFTKESEKSLIPPRKIKSFRIKYFDTLREAIVENFDELYAKHKDDLSNFLTGVDVVIDDLIIIYDEIVPRFPKRYNIFQFYVLEHHRITYEVLNRITSGPIEGGAILKLLKWVREYYDNMNGRLGVGEELLEPRLLDGRQDDLILQYIRIVRTKLTEWMKTLLERETKEFLQREYAPDTDADGLYILSGSILLFQMFNQQLDVASSSSRGPLLEDVISECVARAEEFQKHWITILDSEFKKFESKNQDLSQGLPEYIMALANDCYRSTEFSETLINKLESLADEPYKSQMEEKIRKMSDGFLAVAKRAYTILIDIAILDCKPATSQMYLNAWYEQNLIRLIIGTFEDYCADFQEHLTAHLFTKLINDLLDRFILVYLESLRNKGGKFKMPQAAKQMRDDIKLALDFFSVHKQEKRVRQSMDVLEKVTAFIEANPRMAFVEFYNLWKVYQDVPVSFIEDLVWKRDDLEKAEAKEILESVKDKIKEDTKNDVTPGIFSKLSGKK